MKIAVADNNSRKFTDDLIKYWENKYEVKYERGASEYLAQWADIYYVDTWDNNIHYLYKLYHGDEGVSRTPNWNNKKKPRVIVRALDWEVWIGLARDQKMIDWVDDVVVIAPHIEKELQKHGNFQDKITLIRPGVNLEKFTPKKKKTDGYQIGMVLGDMWWPKNHMAGLDIFYTLWIGDDRWKLHIRGQHEGGDYWPVMYNHYLESRGIKDAVTLYQPQDDMNQWYENIDILLHPGMKEAYCYAIGEAAAKGIPCVVNTFYGSENIWPEEWRYKNHVEAVNKVKLFRYEKPHSGTRKYIEKYYSLERMLGDYDRLLGT